MTAQPTADRKHVEPGGDKRRSMGMAQAVQRCFEAAGGCCARASNGFARRKRTGHLARALP
jgi:hypothetical protein